MIPEIKAAVLTFTCDIDISDFIRKCSGHPKMKHHQLTNLEESRSIRVEGLSPDTAEDLVWLYFESSKHGGGNVESTEMLPDEGAALVTFQCAGVVKTVLKEKHVINNKTLSVYPYYPSIGQWLYGKEGPHPTMPSPVQVPIYPAVLEFIINRAAIQQDLEKHMKNHFCEVTWPSLNQTRPVITLSAPSNLSTHLRTLAKIAPSWSAKAQAEMAQLLTKYKVVECDLTPAVWEAVKGTVSGPSYHRVLIRPAPSADKVSIVGISDDVIKIEPTFRKLVEDTTRQLSRVEDSMPLEPTAYTLMSIFGLEEKTPSLNISYDMATKTVKLCGLKEDVLRAKSDIITTKQGLRPKTINLNAYIVQFLKSTDNENMSRNILAKSNIKAIFQVEGEAVKLISFSDEDLASAEEKLRKELLCKQISVQNRSLTQSQKWKKLRTNLMEMFNTMEKTLVIEEFPMGDGCEVVITGLSSSAEETHKQIEHFVDLNTPVQKDIKVKSAAVMQFLEEKRKQEMDDIAKKVTVQRKPNFLSLSGPKLYMGEAETRLTNLLSALHSDTLYIDKPGAKKFSIENEVMYGTTTKNQFNCIIHLQKEGGASGPEPIGEPLCQANLQNGAMVAIYKGDICNHTADFIIIESTEDLKPTGAPAQEILQAAGRSTQHECDNIIQTQGKLDVGQSILTDGGNLSCKLVHAVGPKSITKANVRLLRKAILSSLEISAAGSDVSVAIALRTFLYSGSPLDMCAKNIVEAIKFFMENQQGAPTGQNIQLVDRDDGTLKAFTEALKGEFVDEIVQVSANQGEKAPSKKSPKNKQPGGRGGDQTVSSKEGLIISIVHGNIQDAASSAIVNSVGKDLDLRYGAVSKALLAKAGSKLQNLINAERGGAAVKDGAVFVTDGCDLACDNVLHVVVPQWDVASSEQIVRNIINRCLRISEERRLISITIPALGTGALGFPKNTVAALMFDEILEFSNKNPPQYLKHVTIMLHPSDTETIQAFSNELDKKLNSGGGSNQKKDNKKQSLFGAVQSPAKQVYEMRIGTVNFQVKIGDITKESCDVLINSTNNTFNLKSAALPNNGYTVTSGGNLPCKHILHLAGQSKASFIKKSILNALRECERLQVKSVALPAMGTGVGGVAPGDVADAILDAVQEFVISSQATTIQTVTVVLFQPQMLNDFHASMQKREMVPAAAAPAKQSSWFFQKIIVNPVKGFFNLMAGNSKEEKEEEEKPSPMFELKENIEPAIFHLCAEKQEDVRKASDWLRDIITKQHYENLITDASIGEVGSKERDVLAQLQRDNGVTINIDLTNSSIKVAGLTTDVLRTSSQIQELLRRMQEQKAREREADLCAQVVQWGYYQGINFVPFDKMINLDLEKARDDSKQSLNIDINGVSYTVIAELKTARDPRGNKLDLERRLINESLGLPTQWDPMDDTEVKVVELTAGTQEYTDVQTLFAQTCLMKIIKIERIQNKSLYQNYQVKKNHMDTKNVNCNNERRLFHGTGADTKAHINSHGFNRGYTDKQELGKGTYFATDANYSASEDFSKPDSNGHQYMYLARVLTGIFCKGTKDMIVPLAKDPNNPTDLCDSAADHLTNPSVFVIFYDYQAYPEYLITFSK
ncbi:protein mono-ADP-ribosyltransferase PARP14-like [Gastrophryne carolinensis]